jgi:FdhE protein
MPERVSSDARWDQRSARARTLAAEHPAAHHALTFYAALAAYQKSLVSGSEPAAIVDVDSVLAAIPDFLTWLSGEAPAPLAAAAVEMLGSDLVSCTLVLFWRHLHERTSVQETRSDPNVRFVAEALLQPFVEQWTRHETTPPAERSVTPARCPNCASLPVLAVLREEGHGAKRTLLCSLCFTEWDYRRILCPHCGEQQFDALPVYTAEQFEYVRIEACTSCQRYIKTIDLTKNGLAVPPVDDIASVSLDLWAREQGYVRIRENLLAL